MTGTSVGRPRVKICGITRPEDALRAAGLGASALGFVFWPASPRCVAPEAAARIIETLPPAVVPVGVFVDQPLDEVRRIAALARLGAIQLHGHEPEEYWRALEQPIIKAVAVTGPDTLRLVTALPAAVTPLLDVHDPVRRGGTGHRVDWSVAAAAAAARAVFLSGGLRPENVADAIACVHPHGVDVSSGVESQPGVKDPARLEAFFDAIERAEHR